MVSVERYKRPKISIIAHIRSLTMNFSASLSDEELLLMLSSARLLTLSDGEALLLLDDKEEVCP